MFNGKFIITLVAVIAAIFAICNLNTPSIVENFWGNPARTFKVNREVMGKSGDMYSIPNNYQAILNTKGVSKGDFFQVPGTFQSQLNPRFSNVDYGANIRYNLPSENKLGVPNDPLSLGNMVKENYCGSCGSSHGVAGCRKGGLPELDSVNIPSSRQNALMASNYSDPSYQGLRDKLQYMNVTDVLPAGDMTTVNALGEIETPITYDRFIYANQRSRLYGRGDPIRGDLPITPCSTGWFQVSVHPHIDLRDGAMAVMGGLDNSTSKALYELQTAAAGGVLQTMGGVDMGDNLSTSQLSALGAGPNDLIVSSFP